MSYAKYNHDHQSGYLFTSIAHVYKRQKAGQETYDIELMIGDRYVPVMQLHFPSCALKIRFVLLVLLLIIVLKNFKSSPQTII